MSRIIGIVGLAGAGKNTVADILINNYGYELDSFAKPLKDITALIFGWDREMVEGATKESRQWREKNDTFWSEKLNKDISPRKMLQFLGTDLFRKHLHQDIWINSFLKRNSDPDKKIVVADVRFPNEIRAIKSVGGKIVRVKRGKDPEWLNQVMEASNSYYFDPQSVKTYESHVFFKTKVDLPHISEWAWTESKDLIHNHIDNSGTLQDLEDNVIDFIDPKGRLLMQDITTESV